MYRKTRYYKTKKAHNYQSVDGIIQWNVSIYPKINCNCIDKKTNTKIPKCIHVNEILKYEYGLSDYAIEHINVVYNEYADLIKDKLNNDIEAKLDEYFDTEICGFCLESLNINKHALNCCKSCNKYSHQKCVTKWNSPECIYCRQSMKTIL